MCMCVCVCVCLCGRKVYSPKCVVKISVPSAQAKRPSPSFPNHHQKPTHPPTHHDSGLRIRRSVRGWKNKSNDTSATPICLDRVAPERLRPGFSVFFYYYDSEAGAAPPAPTTWFDSPAKPGILLDCIALCLCVCFSLFASFICVCVCLCAVSVAPLLQFPRVFNNPSLPSSGGERRTQNRSVVSTAYPPFEDVFFIG